MSKYMDALSAMMKDWKKSVPAVVLTVARIYYGYRWMMSGIGKIGWFSDGVANSAGLITRMANNLAGPEVTRFDPLMLNRLWAWFARTVFVDMLPGVTDALVVISEILFGLAMIAGAGIFWAILVAIFLNLQFFAGGSLNNFGYMITNLIYWQFHKIGGAIGVDGFLRVRKGGSIA